MEITNNWESLERKSRLGPNLGPFGDPFWTETIRISGNFGFRKQIALVNAPNRFWNRSGC